MIKWEMVRLGDICNVLNGFAFKSEKYVSSGLRVIRITNVQKGFIEDYTPQFYPMDEYNNLQKFLLFNNDLLLSLTGNVGRVAIITKEFLPAALNQRVACLRIKDESKLNKNFLFSYLNSDNFENACINSSQGIAQKNMSTEWLKEFEIPLPHLEEQRKIANELDKINCLISKRKRQLEKLDLLLKSKFNEMFGDPVTNSMGWECDNLLKLGNCKNGMNFGASEIGIDIYCLGVGDFKDVYSISDVTKLSKVSLEKMPTKEYLLTDGDIIFVRSNGNKNLVGRCVEIFTDGIPVTFSGFCIRYRKTVEYINTKYLLYMFKHVSIRNKLLGRGANIQNLNQQMLGELNIPLPPIDLQNLFADYVLRVEKAKTNMQKGLKKLETLYNAKMQEYFE